MKRIVITSLLGITVATGAFGQGSIIFDNYSQGTYNQVVWGNPFGHVLGSAVQEFISVQLYFGEGTGFSSIGQLNPGISTVVDPARTYPGAAGICGWFSGGTQLLPTWASGDVFTFAVVVTEPGHFGSTVLWQETGAIHTTMSQQSGFLNFPGLVVDPIPEPSAFALASTCTLAWISRRRLQKL